MLSLLILPLALVLDFILGEPKKWHPLIGFGALANRVENRLNQGQFLLLKGSLAWCLVVLPLTLAVFILDQIIGGWWLSLMFGWLAIGWHSLRQHGQWILQALQQDDLPQAREKVGWIVSRDTSKLNESQISQASIESILENGSDAIFAPLFWLAIGGAPAVVLYRLSNTLDAMWGYRSPRFERFGKFAARVDDLLNIIPARLTAFSYACVGNFTSAIQAWRQQASQWYSPNAGVVMATGAGALQVQLGGTAIYHGKTKSRPTLGSGNLPQTQDLQRAIKLVDHSVYLWAAIAACIAIGGQLL